jgi:diguanylate cyclase (GGDEF)-like protein
MHNADGTLLGVLSVDHPSDGLVPGLWERESLQLYADQATLAIANARLRADVQRASVRLEREHTQLHVSEERLRRTVTLTQRPMALATLHPDQPSELLKVNDALCQLLGRSPNALLEFSIEDLVHPDDLHRWLRMPLTDGGCDLRLARRDGTYLHTSISAAPITDTATAPGGPRYLITLEHTEPSQLHHGRRLHRDALTGALSGAALRAELHRLCDTPADRTSTTSLAVIFVGLDDFTQLNADYGQAVGDAVLVEVVERLTRLARAGDLVARVGGDEFALLTVGRTYQQIEEIMPRIQASLARPVRIGVNTLWLRASVGLAWAKHGMTPDQVLNSADQEMYFVKTLRKTAHLSQVS